MVDLSFPKKCRLLKENDYKAVYEGGRKVKAWPILAYVRPNGLEYSRLGMAVSKKVGHSPRRNRVKRIFRESFRLSRHELPAGYDLILIPLDRARDYTLDEVQRALKRLFA